MIWPNLSQHTQVFTQIKWFDHNLTHTQLDDDYDDADDDLYIIGAVCLSQKSLFCIQRIWLFHTFIATFRTQRNWSFPCL